MEEYVTKLLLLILVLTPFAALLSDTLGRTDGLMSRATVGVSILFAIALVFEGFQQRPHFANLVFGAFCAWPVFLLIAKAMKPSLSWYFMWMSVPIMTWFLVNLMISLSDSGPFSGVFGIFLGWIYMLVPFGILSLMFVGTQRLRIGFSRSERE